MARVTAQWFELWDGKFQKDDEPLTLEARETPKTLFVTLPGGAVIRLRKFGRRDGLPNSSWRHYYGGKISVTKRIDFQLIQE